MCDKNLHQYVRVKVNVKEVRYYSQQSRQWVMGHGSNGSTNVNGSRGSRVSAVNTWPMIR